MRFAIVSLVMLATACEIELVDAGDKDWSRASSTEPPYPPTPPTPPTPPDGSTVVWTDGSCLPKVDREKELVITQRSVLDDPRFGFRGRMKELSGSDEASFTYAWIDQWRTVTEVGTAQAPVTPRPNAAKVLADPFALRLLAVVNRADLRSNADGCSGAGGELRFVYGAPFAFTVILEIPWPATRTPREWTEAWHALGRRSFGDDYNSALAALTNAITSASPPATWKVRTNERAFASSWEMRDFALVGGALVQVPIANTPRFELERSASLESWLGSNRGLFSSGVANTGVKDFTLPPELQAGTAPIPSTTFRWDSSTLTETERARFSGETCNGCHGGEHASALSFQHIAAANAPSYYASTTVGETQLSGWLRDEELPRRERSVRAALCAASCVTEPDRYGGYGP